MKTTLLTAVAAIALSLGAVSANAATPSNDIGISVEKNTSVVQAGCYYRYFYVYNAYGYYYQYRYICY